MGADNPARRHLSSSPATTSILLTTSETSIYMSAGGLLEIPAFMVGLSGIISLVEKGLSIWQVIASSQYFGEDLVKIMCKLHFEYALFHAWCEGVGVTPTRAGATVLVRNPPATQRTGPRLFADDEARSPFYIAVSQIVETLEKIQEISANIRRLQSKRDRGVERGVVETSTPAVLAIALGNAAIPISLQSEKKSIERRLNKISIFWRAKFQVSISATVSEREQLEKLISEFVGWNRDIWNFLPVGMKDAVICKYLPATVFDFPFDPRGLGVLQDASKDRFPAISNTAHLWIEKEQIESEIEDGDPHRLSVPLERLTCSGNEKGSWQLATLIHDAPGKHRSHPRGGVDITLTPNRAHPNIQPEDRG